MSAFQRLAKAEEFELNLIECTRQPGRLRISREACALRYRLAHKENARHAGDEFQMARSAGLEICRGCPEGRVYAGRLKKTWFLKPAGKKSSSGQRERDSNRS